jgi:hypothetical protein
VISPVRGSRKGKKRGHLNHKASKHGFHQSKYIKFFYRHRCSRLGVLHLLAP